jgi:hypothetical protein
VSQRFSGAGTRAQAAQQQEDVQFYGTGFHGAGSALLLRARLRAVFMCRGMFNPANV